MSLYYVSIIDKYIGKYNVFSSKEIKYIDYLEKQWQQSQKDYSFYELLQIFPEARPAIRKNLIANIKQLKQDLIKAEEVKIEFNNKILSRVKNENKWFYSAVRDILYVAPLKEGREKQIKRNYFLLSVLKPRTGEAKDEKITEQDILKVKEFPIDQLYSGKLVRRGGTLVGLCPFHNDQHNPNFTIYIKTNRFYCYSCGANADSIDFVTKKYNCTFIEAIKILLNK
ncbi:MAG: CHC2 zinc finger domain-containing protein [Nanoarchaeota archaeon]